MNQLLLDDNVMFAEDIESVLKGGALKVGDKLFNHKRASNFVVVGVISGRVYFLIECLADKLSPSVR